MGSDLSANMPTGGHLCIIDNFSCFCFHLLTFFKIDFFKIFFQEHCRSVKQFGSRSGKMSVSPDMAPNCFKRLSALIAGKELNGNAHHIINEL